MAIDYPNSPTNGQIYTVGAKSWIWDGTTWLAYGASLSPTVLKVDSVNARVGVNNQSPAYALDVNGTIEGTQFLQGTDYLSPYQGFRNKVINGNMSVWQRGTSVAVSTLGYTADRWFHQSYNGATISRQPTSDTSVLPNVQYCARVQRNSGVTSTNFMYFTQSMETQESIKVSGKTITLSFYARKGANFSATSNAFKAELFYGTGTDQNMIFGYTGQAQLFTSTFTLTSSWVRYSVTATIPVTSTEITPLFGYTPTGTAGANDYFEITGVQLEEGSVATPLEQRPIQQELALCQRYYEKSYELATVPGTTAISGAGVQIITATSDPYGNVQMALRFAVPKRTKSYTVFTWDESGTASTWAYGRSGVSGTSTAITDLYAETSFRIYVPVGVAWTAALIVGHWAVSAEL